MFAVVLLCIVGLAFGAQPDCGNINLPHGHSLTTLVDRGFDRMDTNGDKKVTTDEFEALLIFDDKNNDSCISYAEYNNAETKQEFIEVDQKMYQHFDPDNDDCLDVDEMNAEFDKIDTSGNGLIETHEYEHYFTNLLKHLYGPGSCHGNGK